MYNCWFMDWVEVDGIRFFYSPQFHSIMKVGMEEERVEVEKQLVDEKYYLPGKFITMEYFNHKLYFFPLYGQSVSIYDLSQKKVEDIQLEASVDLSYSIFSSACVKEKIVGIPGRYSRFVIIDCINSIKREIELDRDKMNNVEISRSVYFTRSNYVYDNVLFVGSLLNNYIVSVSLDTYKVEYYEMECCDEEKKGIYTLCGNASELYVLGNDGKLRIYEFIDSNLSLKKVINISCITLSGGAYSNSLYMNGHFIMFSKDGTVICDISNGKAKKCSFGFDSTVKNNEFYYAYKSGNIIQAMSAMDFVEYFLDEDMNVKKKKRYFVEDDELCKLRPCSLVAEQKDIYIRTLNSLINYLKRK